MCGARGLRRAERDRHRQARRPHRREQPTREADQQRPHEALGQQPRVTRKSNATCENVLKFSVESVAPSQ